MRWFSLGSLLIFAIICGETRSREINVYWRDYGETIPNDALSTGHGTYIAQVVVRNGDQVPATFYPSTRTAVMVVNARREETTSNIKLLCTPYPQALKWEHVNVEQLNSSMLQRCVKGGFEDGITIYIGKVFHEGEWKIGRVIPPTNPKYKGLRVWWNNGDGYFPTDFQILMAA